MCNETKLIDQYDALLQLVVDGPEKDMDAWTRHWIPVFKMPVDGAFEPTRNVGQLGQPLVQSWK